MLTAERRTIHKTVYISVRNSIRGARSPHSCLIISYWTSVLPNSDNNHLSFDETIAMRFGGLGDNRPISLVLYWAGLWGMKTKQYYLSYHLSCEPDFENLSHQTHVIFNMISKVLIKNFKISNSFFSANIPEILKIDNCHAISTRKILY